MEHAEREKSRQLFKDVKNHVFENLSDENVPLLSSIARATTGFTGYDFHSVDDALGLIHKHFGDFDDNIERQEIYATFADRLAVENAQQLTEKYNHVMENVRKFFPEFNLAHRAHNPIFGSDAIVSCQIRRCSKDDVANELRNGDPFAEDVSPQQIERQQAFFDNFYETEYDDTVQAKAMSIRDMRLGIFPKGLKSMFSYEKYTGNGYMVLNDFFRCNKASVNSLEDMVGIFTRFAQNLCLPFYTDRDFRIYRGDGFPVSAQTLETKGFFSGSLSVVELGKFVKSGGRMIQINIPKGTPFLPLIMERTDEGEISLLPGTVLEKQSEMLLENGHFAEYTVAQNPPGMTELEEATIFKNIIPERFEDIVGRIKLFSEEKGKQWASSLPEAEGVASQEDILRFAISFINAKYGGDW